MVFKKRNHLYKKREKSFKGKNNPFYGKRHTEDSKNKQRVKWKEKYDEGYTNPWEGKHPTNETRKKMKEAKENYIPWNKGLHGEEYLNHYHDGKLWCDGLTKETDKRIAKYAEKLIGRDFSEVHKQKISDSRWGKDNPAWAGGNSFYPYSHKFNRKLKKEIAVRDNFTCQLCGEKPDNANVHHWNYNKKETDPFYLVYTCRSCNTILNYHREFWEGFFYDHQIKRRLSPKQV